MAISSLSMVLGMPLHAHHGGAHLPLGHLELPAGLVPKDIVRYLQESEVEDCKKWCANVSPENNPMGYTWADKCMWRGCASCNECPGKEEAAHVVSTKAKGKGKEADVSDADAERAAREAKEQEAINELAGLANEQEEEKAKLEALDTKESTARAKSLAKKAAAKAEQEQARVEVATKETQQAEAKAAQKAEQAEQAEEKAEQAEQEAKQAAETAEHADEKAAEVAGAAEAENEAAAAAKEAAQAADQSPSDAAKAAREAAREASKARAEQHREAREAREQAQQQGKQEQLSAASQQAAESKAGQANQAEKEAVGEAAPAADASAASQEGSGGAVQFDASSCPEFKSAPRGLLYNHVGKTGGTVFKELLIQATGACNGVNCPVKIVNLDRHIPGNSPLLGPRGGLVIQDDYHQGLKVTAEDAATFFTIGLVRRPCDFMISSWAYMSERQQKLAGEEFDSSKWGALAESGFDNSADRQRFSTWVQTVSQLRDNNKTKLEGATYMSVALRDRYEDLSLVHCWVRTHNMVEDTKKCMAKYEKCGGIYVKEGLTAHNVATAQMRAESGDTGSKHAACSKFFANQTTMGSVMESEAEMIETYNLDQCCSE